MACLSSHIQSHTTRYVVISDASHKSYSYENTSINWFLCDVRDTPRLTIYLSQDRQEKWWN